MIGWEASGGREWELRREDICVESKIVTLYFFLLSSPLLSSFLLSCSISSPYFYSLLFDYLDTEEASWTKELKS